MPHEKPHRRLTLTQPTAVPTRSSQEESLSQDAQEVERRLRTELAAIQERMDTWDFLLLRLSEAIERVASVQRVPVTRTFQSARSGDATVFPRLTAPQPCREPEEAPPSTATPSPTARKRRVRVSTKRMQAGESAQDAAGTPDVAPASRQRGSAERSGGTVRIEVVPTVDPPQDRLRIQVRDTSGAVTPRPNGHVRPYARAG